jgi:hypothetical protein
MRLKLTSHLVVWMAFLCANPLAHAQQSSDILSAAHGLQPCPSALKADDTPDAPHDKPWQLMLSPYAEHWHYNPEHRPVRLISLERQDIRGRFCGLAFFTNSFGQPSLYGFVGQRWTGVMGNPHVFFKLSGGLIYGYKGAYKDKIPFNNYGIAPAVIPSLGYHFSGDHSVQASLLGTAGFLLAYSHDF